MDIAAREDSGEEEDEELDKEAEISAKEAERLQNEIFKKRDRAFYPIEQVLNDKMDPEQYAKEKDEEDQPLDDLAQVSTDLASAIHLPSSKDPSLWFVTCKRGSEKLACISLMQKAFVMMQEKTPLLILSVTSLNSLKGHIYIEAYKEAHVRQAIEGLHIIGQKVSLVPLKEMAEIYTMARAKKTEIKKGDWVRIKSGTYSGDLARVVEVNPQMTRVKVKIVPRLEPEGSKVSKDDDKDKNAFKNPSKIRPPQRLFDPVQYNCKMAKPDPVTHKLYYNWANMNFRKGFLYKDFSIKRINTDDIVPTYEELQMFTPAPKQDEEDFSEDDEKINMQLIKKKKFTGIVKGDKVQVTKGELKGLKGIVLSVNDSLVNVQSLDTHVTGNIPFPACDLEKFFKEGDFVYVISGQYKGESGLITEVEGSKVYLFSETKKREIEVRAGDLATSMEAAPDTSEQHNFRTNDLVIYNNSTSCGNVLSVERDTLNVLDCNGEVKTIRASDINAKKDFDAPATDSARNSIRKGDSVKVIDGEFKGKRGTIVHIHKSFVFLYNADHASNNGIFVEKSKNLLILGAELLKGNNDLSTGGKGRGRFGLNRRDELINKVVIIKSGPYKGYQGLVTEADRTSVRVELSSQAKEITVDRSNVTDASNPTVENPIISEAGAKTPAYFPQSPHWVSSTPAPQSPGYDAGIL